jgi:transposase-like protein
VKGLKTKKPYFVADSEAECKKYSTKYKSSVLVVLFESEVFRSDIIYAESDETFGEIHKLIDLRDKRIADYEFYDIIGKPRRVYDWGVKIPRRMSFTNYPVNLFIYFLWRIRKFRGISPEKIILHLKETEWRLNKISTNLKLRQAPRDEIKLFNKVSKDLYDELLETLRNNPL